MNYITNEKKLIFADKVLGKLANLERWNNYNNTFGENVSQYERHLVEIGKVLFEDYYEELLEPEFDDNK